MHHDTMTNLAAQLAVGGASKLAQDKFGFRQLGEMELEAMYRSDWVSRKIIDAPVEDIESSWRSWQATKEQITAIEDAERRHQTREKIALAMTWARLYGGSVIIIGADTSNPALPFNPSAVKKGGLKYLTVLPRRMITPIDRNLDPVSAFYGQPQHYTISSQVRGSVEIHPSRVIRFLGKPRPDLDTNSEGWGDSVLQIVYDAVHHAALSSTAVAELLHEAKVDVVQVPNLGAMLSTDQGTQALTKRFTAANSVKSINRMLLLDKEELHSRTQTTFAGLSDIMQSFMQMVAGAADMPVTRLLGTSPKGLNSTGEHDEKNYHKMLDGLRNKDLRPKLELLDEILWRDATGSVPKDVFFTFNPLAQMSDTEKATLAKTKAETAQIYVNMAIMPEEALAEGIVNALIEDGTYPGLEAAIEEEVGENGDLIPEDPAGDLELERQHAEIQAIRNAPRGKQAARDRAPPRASDAGLRDRLADDAELTRQIYLELDARKRARGGQG